MKNFNDSYVLPNPPAWHTTTVKAINRLIARLTTRHKTSVEVPARVSSKYSACFRGIDIPIATDT